MFDANSIHIFVELENLLNHRTLYLRNLACLVWKKFLLITYLWNLFWMSSHSSLYDTRSVFLYFKFHGCLNAFVGSWPDLCSEVCQLSYGDQGRCWNKEHYGIGAWLQWLGSFREACLSLPWYSLQGWGCLIEGFFMVRMEASSCLGFWYVPAFTYQKIDDYLIIL